MPACPIGHDSGTDDYCEVCGRLMSGGAAPSSNLPPPPPGAAPYPGSPPPAAPVPGPAATAAAETCPRCGTPREGAEPFCEECRWNFPAPPGGRQEAPPSVPSHLPPAFPRGSAPPAQPSWPGQPSRPMPPGPGPAASPHAPPPPAPAPAPPPAVPQPAPPPANSDFLLAPPGGGAPVPSPDPRQEEPPAPPAAPARPAWYVVVSADREYFAAMMARSGPEAQGLFFPPYCPERRFELTGNQLRIGRMRHRRGDDVPDIDLSRPPEDPGVSHRHAILVQQPDGTWSVIDQDSTNGTTINLAEDPIAAHVPVNLNEGDRVHVGAWTTITLHRT